MLLHVDVYVHVYVARMHDAQQDMVCIDVTCDNYKPTYDVSNTCAHAMTCNRPSETQPASVTATLLRDIQQQQQHQKQHTARTSARRTRTDVTSHLHTARPSTSHSSSRTRTSPSVNAHDIIQRLSDGWSTHTAMHDTPHTSRPTSRMETRHEGEGQVSRIGDGDAAHMR